MNALVTGGAGFIGSHLTDALVAEHDVAVFDDFSSGCRSNVHPDARLIEGSLEDEHRLTEAVGNADVVFHQAASVSVARSIEDPIGSHAVNVDGTLSVLEAARRHDTRCVLASSAAIYGQPDSVPIAESAPTTPESPYGLEKLSVDQYARLYNDLYDLPTVALRYFNVYGPRQTAGDYSGVISVFLKQALENEPITIHGDGTQTRDFVHVSDVIQANLRAMETDAVGEAYNVATGETTTIVDLARTVRSVADSNSEIVHTDARIGDIDRSHADITKARKRLGYEPTIGLEEGLRNLLKDRAVP